ncbi:hypothetical protein ACGFY7_23355 [Streptomyces prunicolor]|uniref:hypothetical protein n=1 Tax=Streptomyces prunicolor TaxID=67348 RepID=UPI003724606D
MIEITIRLKPGRALHFAALLRAIADLEGDRGQAKHYRGGARQIERHTRTRRPRPQRPAQRPQRPASRTDSVRPFRYTPRVQRPHHPGIDESAVQRVLLGLRPLPILSRAEARLACWHLTGDGCSAPEIARRLSVAQRTINRWRAEDRQAATS